MSNEYQIGKDIEKLTTELEKTNRLVQQLYGVISHNIQKEKIVDLPGIKEDKQ